MSFRTRASAVLDLLRELAYLLSKSRPNDEIEELPRRYSAEWHELIRATAAVEVGGPNELGAAAVVLRDSIGNLANVVDTWYEAHRRGPVNDRWAAYREAEEELEVAREAFVKKAQAWWRDPYGDGVTVVG